MSEYGITRRTANRDLLDLMSMRLDLEADAGGDGRKLWHAASRSRKFSVSYSMTELMALFLGRRFFDFLAGTLLEEDFDKVIARARTQLGRAKDRERAAKLDKKLYLVHEGPKKLPKRGRGQRRSSSARQTCSTKPHSSTTGCSLRSVGMLSFGAACATPFPCAITRRVASARRRDPRAPPASACRTAPRTPCGSAGAIA
jgi:hypothetical protein